MVNAIKFLGCYS